MDPTATPAETNTVSDASLVRQLADGQEVAAEVLYRRYADRIRSLARARMPDHLTPRLDSEDVVQSVFRAFFDSTRKRLYDVPDGDSLWRLLAVVTVNKLRSLHEHHGAARRDSRATVGWGGAEALSSEESQTDLLEVAVKDVLEKLSEPERKTVELRVEGYEVAEIAHRIGRSKRSVERSLKKARHRLSELLDKVPS